MTTDAATSSQDERVDPEAEPAPATRREAPWLVLAALAAVIICVQSAMRPLDDIDLYWHLLVGEDILGGTPVTDAAHGWSFAPVPDTWVTTQWLGEVFFAWLHRVGGFQAMVVYRTATVILALAVLAAVTLKGRPARAGAWPFAVAGLALAFFSQDRTQQISYILAPLVGWWALQLWRSGRLPRWWIVLPLVVVWANVHGGWLILPMALVLASIARALDAGLFDRAVVRGLLLAIGCALAAAVAPSGIDNVLSFRRFADSTDAIAEWGAARAFDPQALPLGIMAITVVVAWALGRARPTRGEVALVVTLVVFGYSAWRSITPACLILAPLVTGSLARALGLDDPLPRGTRQPLARTALGAAAVGAVLALVLSVLQQPVLDPDFPMKLLRQLRDDPLPQRVLNTYNIAGPLLYFGGPPPHVIVGVDGRADRYGNDYIDRYMNTLMQAAPGYEDMLEELAPTTALLKVDEPLAGVLEHQRGWTVLGTEGRYVLLRAPQPS